jgi:excinuclease ABC subunit A
LRDTGNSVIVVEHDKEMIEQADYVLDIGPKAGIHGGKVVASGTPQELLLQNSITAKYLRNEMQIAIPQSVEPEMETTSPFQALQVII